MQIPPPPGIINKLWSLFMLRWRDIWDVPGRITNKNQPATVFTRIDDQADQQAFRIHFLRMVFWANSGLMLFSATIALIFWSLPAGLAALILVGTSVALLWARTQMRVGQAHTVGMALYLVILFSGVSIVAVIPTALPVALIAPITAVVFGLPFVNRSAMRMIVLIAWLTTIPIILIAEFVHVFPPAPWLHGFPLLAGTTYITGLVLFLLWRYQKRLFMALDNTQAANNSLVSIRAELEATIAARTAALREREGLFRAISELTTDHTYILRAMPDGSFEQNWISGATERLTGYSANELLGLGGFDAVIHPDDQAESHRVHMALLHNQPSRWEFRLIQKSGDIRWLRSYAQPQWNEAEQRVTHIIAALQDITEERRYEERIEQLAFFDPLTGLANRTMFQDQTSRTLAEGQTGCALLFLDLDRFKTVNDTLGHDAGDTLLQQVAVRLRQTLRDGDLLARLGGDEFALLMHDADGERATAMAYQMLQALDQSFRIGRQAIRVSGSIGIALAPWHSTQYSALLQFADIAMYRAKRRGAHVEVFNTSLTPYPIERLQLEAELRLALERNEFEVHYQPIVQIEPRIIQHVEALIRWRHSEHGLIPPGQFIPLAEECGLIYELDRWMLRTAVAQIAAWMAEGYQLGIAVNLSTYSLQDIHLVDQITSYLHESGAEPARLLIEVTESAAMHDIDITVMLLQKLQRLGVGVALDDFGASYSSLSRLKQLPVDVLKIDREFISGIGLSNKDEGVLHAIVALGRGLGMDIIAEGVETAEQLRWLKAAGYTHAQGYFLGMPTPTPLLALQLAG